MGTLVDALVGTCDACRFFHLHTRFDPELRADVNLKTGDCRRSAPRARIDRGQVAAGFWPRVGKASWCGEFDRRQTTKAGD